MSDLCYLLPLLGIVVTSLSGLGSVRIEMRTRSMIPIEATLHLISASESYMDVRSCLNASEGPPEHPNSDHEIHNLNNWAGTPSKSQVIAIHLLVVNSMRNETGQPGAKDR